MAYTAYRGEHMMECSWGVWGWGEGVGGGGDPGVGKRKVRKIEDAESSGPGYWDQGLRPT